MTSQNIYRVVTIEHMEDLKSLNIIVSFWYDPFCMKAGNTMATNLKVSHYIHCSQHSTQHFRDMFI